jgi:glycosyltransferase involved in cell wall biosynthesis
MGEQRRAGLRPGSGKQRDRLKVLLATEHVPHAPSGLDQWTASLLEGLPEVDFILWSVRPDGAAERGRPPGLPSNVSRVVEVSLAASDPFGARRSLIPAIAPATRVADRTLERAFLPLLHEFLDECTSRHFDPDGFARLLSALRAHFEVWDYRTTWASRAVWDAFHERVLALPEPPPEGEDGGLIGAAWRFPGEADGTGHDAPTVAETTEGLRHLCRALATVTAELPVTDLAHAASGGLCSIPCILAKVEREAPFLLTEPAVFLRQQYLALAREALPFSVKRLLLRVASAVAQTAYHLADRVAPVSEWAGRWEQTYGAAAQRIQVVYPGVDERVFRPGSGSGSRSSRPTVLALSPIEPSESLLTMLEVADRVRQAVPDALFVHHGPVIDEAYRDRLQARVRERRLQDTVRFLGPTDHPEAALNDADVLLSTSTAEAFPPSVIQALACGTPAVSPSVGGIHEALDGPGITAPPGDVEGLAEAVVAILRLPADQRDVLSRAARSIALQKFRLSAFVDRYRESYLDLAGVAAEPAPAAPAAPATREGASLSGPIITLPDGLGAGELRLALHSRDPFVRVSALSQTAEGPGLAAVVAEALSDDYPQVRREAVRALGRIGGPLAGRALAEAIAHDTTSEVRDEAVAALATLLATRIPARARRA